MLSAIANRLWWAQSPLACDPDPCEACPLGAGHGSHLCVPHLGTLYHPPWTPPLLSYRNPCRCDGCIGRVCPGRWWAQSTTPGAVCEVLGLKSTITIAALTAGNALLYQSQICHLETLLAINDNAALKRNLVCCHVLPCARNLPYRTQVHHSRA